MGKAVVSKGKYMVRAMDDLNGWAWTWKNHFTAKDAKDAKESNFPQLSFNDYVNVFQYECLPSRPLRPSRLTLGLGFMVLLAVLLGSWASCAWAHKSKDEARLPSIGPAPGFTLTTQAGKRLSMRNLSGSVVVVTFIFTSCRDTCPMLTAKLVQIKKNLARKLGKNTVFAAITVDPEKDTPAVLAKYAKALGATDPGWVFLSGSPEEVRDVTRRYAIFAKKQVSGDVDHTFLTSLIDRKGMIRVQYLGVRFSPKEFMQDLQSLLGE